MNKIGMSVDGGKNIYNVDFAKYLPEALKTDEKICAIAEALSKNLSFISNETQNAVIYSRIDDLPEALLDVLAYDMHIDWYDYSYPLTVKRNVLKNSVKTHKKIGTKRAVEELIKDVFGGGEVEEWFEYGDSPFYFKIKTDAALTPSVKIFFDERIQQVKNVRSHLRSIEIHRIIDQNLYAGVGQHRQYKTSAIIEEGMQPVGRRKEYATTF